MNIQKRILAAVLLFVVSPARAQTVEYIHTDALGSPVAVTDVSGAVIEQTVYEPYGAVINRPLNNRPGYTGHVEDAVTGLNYMQQRYYDPQLGRFLSNDAVAATSGGENFNRYWYANNNPYKYVDPTGNCPSCLIGVLVEVGFQAYTGELNNAFSQAFDGNFGALAISVGKMGVAAASGGISTIAAAKTVSLVSSAYKAAEIGKVATAVVKVETLAATQAAVGAATKVATNAIEGKPLGDGVGTAAAVAATVGTAGSLAGNKAATALGAELGANAGTVMKSAAQIVTGAAKKETSCSIKEDRAC